MEKHITFLLLYILVYPIGVFLRHIDDFVDDLHDFLWIVSRRVVLEGNVVFIKEVVLIVLSVWDFFDEVLDLPTGPLGVLLRVLVDEFGDYFLQAFVQKLDKRGFDILIKNFLDLLASLLDVQQYVFGGIGLSF